MHLRRFWRAHPARRTDGLDQLEARRVTCQHAGQQPGASLLFISPAGLAMVVWNLGDFEVHFIDPDQRYSVDPVRRI